MVEGENTLAVTVGNAGTVESPFGFYATGKVDHAEWPDPSEQFSAIAAGESQRPDQRDDDRHTAAKRAAASFFPPSPYPFITHAPEKFNPAREKPPDQTQTLNAHIEGCLRPDISGG